MKKLSFGIISCVLALTGAGMVCPAFAYADVYQETANVSSVNDLAGVINRTSVKDSYKMGGDIDGSEISGEVFNGYGADKYFTGTFDGDGYTIKNLNLSSNDGFYGLFPYAKNATIKNLKLENITIDIDEDYDGNIYAGLIVGYGENIIFENCEIILKNDGETQTIPLSNASRELNFGFLGGKLIGNAGLPSGQANISNCIIEGNLNFEQTGDYSANLGLMVGVLQKGFISHSICSGKINYNGEGTSSRNVGGVVGKIEGKNSKIRNVLFGGTITGDDFASLSKGAIVGGKDEECPNENFNYCYWTTTNYDGIGRVSYSNDTFIDNTESISQNFIEDNDKFDKNLPEWDFEKTWVSKNGELRLQRFLTFTISLNATTDDSDSFDIQISNPASATGVVEARYDQGVTFQLNVKSNKQNWCKFSGVRVKGSSLASSLYEVAEVKTGETVTAYQISVKANALTEGGYSFTAQPLSFTGRFEAVADDGSTSDFGGIKIDNAQSTSVNASSEFTNKYQSRSVKAVEEGKYVFKEWKLYYKNGDNFEEQNLSSFNAIKSSQQIDITYKPNSNEIFSKEFKLVAIFTKDAKTITLGGFEKNHIKSISINGNEFTDEGIEVATSSENVVIQIVTKGSAINEIETLVQDFNAQYSKNSDKVLEMVSEQKYEEFGEINYTFKLNVSGVKFSALEDENVISINFTTQKVRMGSSGNLLWLYILLPTAFVGIVITIIILIVRRKSGKGRGRGKQKNVKKEKEEKKSSYKDYYI